MDQGIGGPLSAKVRLDKIRGDDMRRISAVVILAVTAVITPVMAGGMRGSTHTPDVRYLLPANDHDVDLTGQDNLMFKWLALPKPGGGREAYRFELFKGAEEAYNRIYSAELKPNVCAIDISADMFEGGAIYTWRVKQKDAHSSVWSRAGDRWRFTVIKGGGKTTHSEKEDEIK